MAVNNCRLCFDKQCKIDDLQEEVKRLKSALGRHKRKEDEGFFGSSTPSSKKPVKPNSAKKEKKPKGARRGHKGHGRKSHDPEAVDRILDVDLDSESCPQCGEVLEKKGIEDRSVVDCPSHKPERLQYRLHKRYCPQCRKNFTPRPPGVLPRSLYGNQFIANAIEMYYLHGLPMGRISEYTGVGPGSLMALFRRCAKLFETIPDKLIQQYRKAPVKHADETGWRTDGENGYVWLFATKDLSIFQFGKNRSSEVPLAVFGKERLPGTLVVDRYAAYNKTPCHIQYCYAHLLREVQDLEKEFPDNTEVSTFVAVVAPLLALAQGLRSQPITNEEFSTRATKLRTDIKAAMDRPAKHLGIRRIQDIFRDNEHRLYHWAEHRAVPADNNLAERDLRPSVIARKVSFGSATDAGAQVRSVLTTVASTIRKRSGDTADHIKKALDHLVENPEADPYSLLFPEPNPP